MITLKLDTDNKCNGAAKLTIKSFWECPHQIAAPTPQHERHARDHQDEACEDVLKIQPHHHQKECCVLLQMNEKMIYGNRLK